MKLSSLPALACAWLFVFRACAATASGPVTIGKIYPSGANPVSISAVAGGTGVETVTVQDTSGNYVQNTQVTFTVPPSSGPSLTLDATYTQLITNDLGHAQFAGIANSIPGV